ncbi:MAG: ankyrin repeat domain-containing protein [Oceanospirillaceae bacterium]|nr:ankyrin repeat domain-containing protein [Oceanospirillaceae bacterium]
MSASNIPEYKYDYSKKINNELGKAIYQNRVAEITNAVNAGADVQGYINDSPFLSVILHGDCKEPLKPLIELLLSKGANPNARDDIGKTPLMVALNHCSVDIINLLLDHGGDLELSSNHGYSPLLYSVFSGNMETVKIVIERTGIKFNSNAPEIPLISAVEMGAVDIVHLLVKSNIDQCVVNPFNLTARDYAVKYNKLEMMSLLSMQCGEP